MRGDLAEIKGLLQERIEDLCRVLLPRGRREGRLWVSSNPITADHDHEPALKVALNRDVGAWRCWRSGDGGDVVGLVAYVEAGSTRATSEALAFAREWLGLKRMSRDERAALARRVQTARVKAAVEAETDARERMAAVARLWDKAAPLAAGGAAADRVLAWFDHRRVPLARVPNLDAETFRAVADLEWWKGAAWRRDARTGRRVKAKPGPRFPALVSAFRAPTGQVTAVHCTFLDPLGRGKAPVDQARLMFGEMLGSVIRIAHGPEGLPPERAGRPELLVLAEGIETTMSLAIAAPEARAWAGGSLAGVAAAPVGMACVGAVVLSRENDWTTPQAVKQFDAALDSLAAKGKPVAPISSHHGNDFNDLMQEGDDDDAA